MSEVNKSRIEVRVDGSLVGVAENVTVEIDPLVDVELSGTYPDGSTAKPATFRVPQSAVNAGADAVMDYIFQNYGRKDAPQA